MKKLLFFTYIVILLSQLSFCIFYENCNNTCLDDASQECQDLEFTTLDEDDSYKNMEDIGNNISILSPNTYVGAVPKFQLHRSLYYNYIKQTYGYNSIDEKILKKCYNIIEDNIYYISNKCDATKLYLTIA